MHYSNHCRFFEWDRKGGMKRPYFIHFRDNKPTAEMAEVGVSKEEGDGEKGAGQHSSKIEPDVVNGRMLTMAGLFDINAAGRPEVSCPSLLQSFPPFPGQLTINLA